MAQIYRADETFRREIFEGASCAFGVFDGVHRGHRFLIDCAKETAQASGGTSIALTFDIDPDEMFHAQRLKKLMSNEERLNMLASTGVDVVVALPFTRSFAASSPRSSWLARSDRASRRTCTWGPISASGRRPPARFPSFARGRLAIRWRSMPMT